MMPILLSFVVLRAMILNTPTGSPGGFSDNFVGYRWQMGEDFCWEGGEYGRHKG